MSKVLDVLTGGIFREVGDAIDKVVTSDEERLQLRNNLATIETKAEEVKVKAEQFIQGELSKRHQTDMQSDSWLSKNIRPMSLIALVTITIAWGILGLVALESSEGTVVATESVQFQVWTGFLGLLTALDLLAFGFYFGSRGVEKSAEKITAMIMKMKQAQKEKDKKKDEDEGEPDLGW